MLISVCYKFKGLSDFYLKQIAKTAMIKWHLWLLVTVN